MAMGGGGLAVTDPGPRIPHSLQASEPEFLHRAEGRLREPNGRHPGAIPTAAPLAGALEDADERVPSPPVCFWALRGSGWDGHSGGLSRTSAFSSSALSPATSPLRAHPKHDAAPTTTCQLAWGRTHTQPVSVVNSGGHPLPVIEGSLSTETQSVCIAP